MLKITTSVLRDQSANLRERLANMCDNAGPWGKFLQSIAAAGYAYAAFHKYQPFFESIGDLDEVLGEETIAYCFVAMAVVPLVAYLLDILWARVAATTLLVLAWLTVFFAGSAAPAANALMFRPVQWISVLCILAALNAERLIAREVMDNYVSRHIAK